MACSQQIDQHCDLPSYTLILEISTYSYPVWRGGTEIYREHKFNLEAEIESAGCKEVISDDVDVFGEESESSGDDLKRSDEIRQQQEEEE